MVVVKKQKHILCAEQLAHLSSFAENFQRQISLRAALIISFAGQLLFKGNCHA